MIDGKSVLAIIPARGGSKRIKCKNLVEVRGKPLLAWTIDQAKGSQYIDRVILSSEDEEIITAARAYGCEVPFIRPVELATDASPMIDCIHHAMDNVKETYAYVVLLQVTSPLRRTEDIDACIEICHRKKVPTCVSLTESDKSPFWMYKIVDQRRAVPLLDTQECPTRREDSPKFYMKNGAVYVARWDWLRQNDSFMAKDTFPYVMPKERSLDIDSPIDLVILNVVMKQGAKLAAVNWKNCDE